jgi:methyl-accepting chemotaxis protein
MFANVASARRLGLVTSASAIGVGLVLAFLIGRGIARPIRQLTDVMGELANGALETSIPHGNRRDELGEMARAVNVFKDHMLKEAQMTQQQEGERRQAEEDKRAALVKMAETIETNTRIAIEQIGQRTASMAAIANEMRASAARTDSSAKSAGSAAGQALANAQTVASAAGELSASIREIGAQVSQSNDAVGRAVEAGLDTRTTIEALNEKVRRIGLVADMIGDIAAKTNLLALNATIEAARAGDAGKGFAVVASEVKQLANQTAHSTQEIARHIAEVRAATGASVAAVGRIEQTIGEMNAIAGSIAAAVEEQGAATAEIARNVSETATAANNMTTRIDEVSAEADQTGRHAAEVHDNITGLAIAVDDLRHSVIHVVRTSSTEVDRRRTPRLQVDLPCRVEVAGSVTHTAKVVDISDGGASIRGAPVMHTGDTGTLGVDGFGIALPFSVREGEAGALHVSFTLDEAKAATLRGIIERTSRQIAA